MTNTSSELKIFVRRDSKILGKGAKKCKNLINFIEEDSAKNEKQKNRSKNYNKNKEDTIDKSKEEKQIPTENPKLESVVKKLEEDKANQERHIQYLQYHLQKYEEVISLTNF